MAKEDAHANAGIGNNTQIIVDTTAGTITITITVHNIWTAQGGGGSFQP